MELTPLNVEVRTATALSPEASVNGNRFHGTKPPRHVIEEEKPWHAAAALMFARGEVSMKEVAESFGVSSATVSNLLRQDWFQERVKTLMLEHGAKDIMQLFKGEGFNSLVTLVEIRDDKKISPAVRSANARDIIDRAYGKPLQRIEDSRTPTSSDPVAEVQRLEAQNERLRRGQISPPE